MLCRRDIQNNWKNEAIEFDRFGNTLWGKYIEITKIDCLQFVNYFSAKLKMQLKNSEYTVNKYKQYEDFLHIFCYYNYYLIKFKQNIHINKYKSFKK